MAAFTTALLVGAIAGGAFAGGKKLGQKSKKLGEQPAPVTPGPTNANTIAAPPAPAPVGQDVSTGIKAGQQAGQKTRRKFAPPKDVVVGSGRPSVPVSTKMRTIVGY